MVEFSSAVRVLVADDQALLRSSFRLLIDSTPGMEVVGEAGNGEEAVRLAASTRPDVVLMDIRMPVVDGIEATRRICAASSARVLILTMFSDDDLVYAALRGGASGFLLKDASPPELLSAISVIARGEALLSPAVTRRLITEFTRRPPAARVGADLSLLTGREREVLGMVARGLSNAEITAHLGLSLPTVKKHIGRLLAKLSARDRAQLVIAAYEAGLVTASATRADPTDSD
jgi:DNA-binding NarL/FixJ family response regulator